jgi:hypothetical protein
LSDASYSIQVGISPIREHLGQPGIQIHREFRRAPIDRLSQAVAQPIISVACRAYSIRNAQQSVCRVVAVSVHTIIEQVAVIVPGVSHAVYADEAVGVVILVGVGAGFGGLRFPVADFIIGVMEVGAVAVISGGQAVEQLSIR